MTVGRTAAAGSKIPALGYRVAPFAVLHLVHNNKTARKYGSNITPYQKNAKPGLAISQALFICPYNAAGCNFTPAPPTLNIHCMGLDTVDIVLTIEKRLGIALPNHQLEKVITVGDLQNVVWRNITIKEGAKCKSQIVFHRLRKHIISTTCLDKPDFTTGISLNNILPLRRRKLHYAAMQENIQLQLPGLTLTKRWSSFLSAFSIATIFGGLAMSLILINFFNFSKWYLLITGGGMALTHIMSMLLSGKRTNINQDMVSDFIRMVVAINYAVLIMETGTNRKEIDYVVTQVIADVSGIEVQEILPFHKIGDDLGID